MQLFACPGGDGLKCLPKLSYCLVEALYVGIGCCGLPVIELTALLTAGAVGVQEHGVLVFESRRFVELRKKGFWKQFFSAESTGMGIFYTLNVFCIQVHPLWMQSTRSWTS